MTKVEALKQYFDASGRPVTTKEITEFKKSDPAGFEELAQAALAQMGGKEEQS